MSATLERSRVLVHFAKERFTEELADEMMPLWADHYSELAMYQDIELMPWLEFYFQAQKMGSLKVFTARDNEQLVGYQFFFVHPHTHFTSQKIATQDLLFITATNRKGWMGYSFLKWCDEELRHDGVNIIYQHVNKDMDYGSLLKRLGYESLDIVYTRRIK